MSKEHKPKDELIAMFVNFSPVRGIVSSELLDPFFSPFACQTCGDTLAGNRYYCTAEIDNEDSRLRQVEQLEICQDCYKYFFT